MPAAQFLIKVRCFCSSAHWPTTSLWAAMRATRVQAMVAAASVRLLRQRRAAVPMAGLLALLALQVALEVVAVLVVAAAEAASA